MAASNFTGAKLVTAALMVKLACMAKQTLLDRALLECQEKKLWEEFQRQRKRGAAKNRRT